MSLETSYSEIALIYIHKGFKDTSVAISHNESPKRFSGSTGVPPSKSHNILSFGNILHGDTGKRVMKKYTSTFDDLIYYKNDAACFPYLNPVRFKSCTFCYLIIGLLLFKLYANTD